SVESSTWVTGGHGSLQRGSHSEISDDLAVGQHAVVDRKGAIAQKPHKVGAVRRLGMTSYAGEPLPEGLHRQIGNTRGLEGGAGYTGGRIGRPLRLDELIETPNAGL